MSPDVKNAFVNAPILEELYFAQLEGFVKRETEDHALLLRKALYGLRQASREWHYISIFFLKEMGCKNSHADQKMYIRKSG